MALLRLRLPFLFILLLVSAINVEPSLFDAGWGLSHFTSGARGAGGLITAMHTCNDMVGECADDEFMVGSGEADIRRSLARGGRGTRYISYGALKKNQVPCNRRGQSYYGCGKASKVNPYRRGCSAITHCQRNTG